MSVEPDWFISVGVWPLACITPVGRGWQVPKQPPFLLLDGDFPPEPCGTQRICLAESEVEHQGNAFLFCLALILAGDLSIKSHLSLQVCAAPNPQCSSLHLTPALFSESGSAVEIFTVPKVLGRQTPAFKHCCRACLEAQAMKALKDSGTPESEWEGGNQKLHFLILSRPAHIAVADAPLLCSMVEFPFCCFIFISSPGYNVKQAWFGLWAASKLPVSCNGCVVPWPLSADTEGAIEMVYWGGILTQTTRLCSGVDKNNEPQWTDGNPFTWSVWDWINLAVGVGAYSTQVWLSNGKNCQMTEREGAFLPRINHQQAIACLVNRLRSWSKAKIPLYSQRCSGNHCVLQLCKIE